MMAARKSFGPVAMLWGLLLLLLAVSVPAAAHKEHKNKPVTTEQVAAPNVVPVPPGQVAKGVPGAAGEAMTANAENRSQMGRMERLLDWLGRLHPMMVHFPVAFFPAALFAAALARRRPAFAAPVQFLIIAGGVLGPISALLGWFDGGFDVATDDWLLQLHRWLGTAVGVGSLGLGVWAWRRPEAARSPAMIAGLGVITIAIAVQGWFGGAMVHGVAHMDW